MLVAAFDSFCNMALKKASSRSCPFLEPLALPVMEPHVDVNVPANGVLITEKPSTVPVLELFLSSS
jgi:hypothetical protein